MNAEPHADGVGETGFQRVTIDRLPHRPPFRFLTSVHRLEEGQEGAGFWSVTGEEWFFAGHFPGEPVVPGVLLVEALAQLSGLVGLHTVDGGAAPDGTRNARIGGRLVHADVRFDGTVVPPAEVELRSTHLKGLGALRRFEVSALCKGSTVARGTLVLAEVG